jgi:hypothetical protein
MLECRDGCKGSWSARSVGHQYKAFSQEATSERATCDVRRAALVKDQTMLSDTKLVIVMSRNTVLLKDKVLYVVPTADITKFQTANKNAKP